MWLSGTLEMCSAGCNANLGWSLNREFISAAAYMHNKFPSQPHFKSFWVFWRCRQGYLEVSLIRAHLPSAVLAKECIIAWRHKKAALQACHGFDFFTLSLQSSLSAAYQHYRLQENNIGALRTIYHPHYVLECVDPNKLTLLRGHDRSHERHLISLFFFQTLIQSQPKELKVLLL